MSGAYWRGVDRVFDSGARKASAEAAEAALGARVPMWTKDCRVYSLVSLEGWVRDYLRRADRAGWFEVIRAARPCKLYIDFDGPADLDLPEVARFEAALCAEVRRALADDHQYRPVRLEPCECAAPRAPRAPRQPASQSRSPLPGDDDSNFETRASSCQRAAPATGAPRSCWSTARRQHRRTAEGAAPSTCRTESWRLLASI